METWTTATALATVTRRVRFLIAVRPGFIAAGLLAKMVATLDQISCGRVDINIVPGGIRQDFERLGVDSDHAGRYEEAEELMRACRTLWKGDANRLCRPLRGRCAGRAACRGPFGTPRFYQGGGSPRAEALAAREADVYLLWIEPLDQNRGAHRTRAGGLRRVRPRAGVRVAHPPRCARRPRRSVGGCASPDCRRRPRGPAAAAGGGDRRPVDGGGGGRPSPAWQPPVERPCPPCGSTVAVPSWGRRSRVAQELYGYWKLGVDEFILSGFPHVEESVRVRHAVLPRLRACIDGQSGA